MHNLKIKAGLLVVGLGMMTNNVSYAAVTKGESTSSDTIEIISTEMTTSEAAAPSSEEKKTIERPSASTEEVTTEAPTKEDRPATTPSVPSTSEPVERPSTERPTVERPTTEKPVIQKPSSQPSIKPSDITKPTTPVTPTTPSTPIKPSTPSQPAADEERNDGSSDHKINKGKFSPHKGEDYYKSLDKEVSMLVTKELASADENAVKHKQSKKHAVKKDKAQSKKKTLPATGEAGSVMVGGTALFLIGLILVRRTRA